MEVILEDSRKRPDYLLLTQAWLYGWSGSNADRAKRLELSTSYGFAEKSSVESILSQYARLGIRNTSDIFLGVNNE